MRISLFDDPVEVLRNGIHVFYSSYTDAAYWTMLSFNISTNNLARIVTLFTIPKKSNNNNYSYISDLITCLIEITAYLYIPWDCK